MNGFIALHSLKEENAKGKNKTTAKRGDKASNSCREVQPARIYSQRDMGEQEK